MAYIFTTCMLKRRLLYTDYFLLKFQRFQYQMMFVQFNSNTTGATYGSPEFTSGVQCGPCCSIFSVCVVFCRSLFVLFLLAIVLSFFNLRLLITTFTTLYFQVERTKSCMFKKIYGFRKLNFVHVSLQVTMCFHHKVKI